MKRNPECEYGIQIDPQPSITNMGNEVYYIIVRTFPIYPCDFLERKMAWSYEDYTKIMLDYINQYAKYGFKVVCEESIIDYYKETPQNSIETLIAEFVVL